MNLTDINTVVQQKTVPDVIQEEVIGRAKSLIKDGFEVEAIVSLTSVTLDVYDEDGNLVDRIKRRFTKVPVVKFNTEDLD